jgi:hypothetical protein
MKVESWQGINGKLIHDGQKAIVVDDDQALTDQKQLHVLGPVKLTDEII